MRFLVVVLLVFLLSGCEDEREIGNMKQLNGYWQIKQAEVPGIVIKDYKGGLKLDYIKMKSDSTGVRKKMKVSMMDEYKTTPNQEDIKLIKEQGEIKLVCKTPYSQWKETILHLSNDSLVIRNQDDKKYYYSKYRSDEE